MGPIYFDVNVFVELFERTGSISDRLRDVVTARFKSGPPIVTSALTLSEVLVKPFKLGNQDAVDAYCSLIRNRDNFVVHPLDEECLIAAARKRALHAGLKLPDAIHLSAAELAGCSHIISNDGDLVGRTPIVVIPFAESALSAFVP